MDSRTNAYFLTLLASILIDDRAALSKKKKMTRNSLPLFNREYADYTSSVHDPSSGFRWFPLSHEGRLKITSCVDVGSTARLC
jgi:hypothetical protein